MLSRWPIRYKLLLGVAMLCLVVAVLSFSGFQGVYAYRELVSGISRRASELPLANDLTRSVSDLRNALADLRPRRNYFNGADESQIERPIRREEFRNSLLEVKESLRRYSRKLAAGAASESRIDDNHRERKTVREIEQSLKRIDTINRDEDWVFDVVSIDILNDELEHLDQLSANLPTYLHERMQGLRDEVRVTYRTWFVLTCATTGAAALMIVFSVNFFYRALFYPLRLLIQGSRRVAGGDFDHRIHLHTKDEVAELAAAMNDMTSRFQEIRDDLDRQVKERTREIIRSEQLASVGYLAAGVAHEINNPLASIAWSAESLYRRLDDIIPQGELAEGGEGDDIAEMRKYLQTIQDEAFRCKSITDDLLDYSRLEEAQWSRVDLDLLIQGVIDMVSRLSKYRQKKIEFECQKSVIVSANPQEIKQVTLNLMTNALDSIGRDGEVRIELGTENEQAVLVVSDNGCGMTSEVLKHLFEPFFTRRTDGKGTGLGLSITYRIIDEHGGTIMPSSEGPGSGSQFRVTLPLASEQENHEKQLRAA